MSFGSNVAPKRVTKAAAQDWDCPDCGRHVARHWVRCPSCGHKRP